MSNHLPAPTHSSSHRDIAWTFVVKKRLSWFSEMLQLEGTSAEVFQKVIGVPFEFRNAMMVRFYEFLDCRELSTFDTMVTMLLNADDNALVKIAKLCYDRCATFRKFCSALKGENWHARSTTALQSALANFYEEALLMIPVVYFEPNLGQRIRDLLLDQLQKHGSPHSLDECFLLLTSTSKELLIVREHRELLAIAGSIRSNPLVLNRFLSKTSEVAYGELPQEYRRAVDAHVENYSWINTDDIFGRPWNQFDLVDRLRFLVGKDCVAKLNDIDRRRNSKNDSFLALLAELNISGELLTLITSAREFSHLRTHRTEIYVQGMFYLQPLLSEIANRLHLEVDAMKFLSYSEIHSSLRSGTSIPADLLRERRSGMAYDMRDRKITAFFGNAANSLVLPLDPATSPADADGALGVVSGMAASLGRVKGTVKIVHDLSELDKVLDGDILVASMTIPEFVPAMERAAGFITDEGGITCHAAIVSREMGIPCIIGTFNATRILKDGDFIELDAYSGHATILS